MKAYRGSGGMAPFILNSVLDSGGYWASHPGHFSPRRWALGTLSPSTLLSCHWLGTLPTRGVQVTETRQSGREPGAPLCCICFVFLGSIGFNQVAVCRVEGTCGQPPCCVRRSMLCTVTFRLTDTLLLVGGSARKNFFTVARTRSRRPWLGKRHITLCLTCLQSIVLAGGKFEVCTRSSVRSVGEDLRCNKGVEHQLSLEYVSRSAGQEISNPYGTWRLLL